MKLTAYQAAILARIRAGESPYTPDLDGETVRAELDNLTDAGLWEWRGAFFRALTPAGLEALATYDAEQATKERKP